MNKDSSIYKKSLDKANKVYGIKTSAYRSAYIVKTYKELGGKINNKSPKLDRWFKEKWIQVVPYLKEKKIVECGTKTKSLGKACRPLKRITKDTPLTASEINPFFAKKQIELKQKIKGNNNLPDFV